MVLIGSATLREGIDISGGGFKAVILDQLPFEYPKDILLQSKAEKLSGENANSFIDFFLPRAVLYFKQAVGRLIRHEDDCRDSGKYRGCTLFYKGGYSWLN